MVSERRVHALKLSAPDESLVRRGAILVEDALKTASMPETHRVLFIRTLRLGTVRAGRSPATVALAIEQQMHELSRLALYADDPLAQTADAVYFADEIEPYILLLARLARSERPTAWFFPMAVTGWSPHLPDPIRRVVHALNGGHGAAGLAAMVGALYQRGELGAILEALTSHSKCAWHSGSCAGVNAIRARSGWLPLRWQVKFRRVCPRRCS
jgi:hypothetical protein